MAGLGAILSLILVIATKKFHVDEDPRIDAVEELLPGANCGACGTPGCRAFAESLVRGEASPAQCPVNTPEMTEAIANYLGIDAGATAKQVARLACAGGHDIARRRARYEGIETCRGAVLVGGGGKGCPWGCLGWGDCAVVCPFDAIALDQNDLPQVDEDKCTACGKCVDECPKRLYTIHPLNHRLWVACCSLAFGKEAKSECSVACIGCGLCAKDAAPELIAMKSKLAVVDYEKNELASLDAIQRCPTGAIVWLDEEKGVVKGAKAVGA